LSIERFRDRTGSAGIVFDNKLWVVGGEEDLEWKNDVWSSLDGEDWTLVTEAAPFSPRYNHRVYVVNGKLWVVGGADEGFKKLRDVWFSPDGLNWTEVSIDEQRRHSAVSLSFCFQDKLWLAFGFGKELWSTSDGSNWTLESDRYAYPRGAKEIVECNNKLIMFTRDKDTHVNRVWSSEDAINWAVTELKTDAFIEGDNVNVLLHKEEIWVFTYNPIDERASLWTSRDGKEWNKKTGSIYFGQVDVNDAYLVVFDGELYMVGGNREIRQGNTEKLSKKKESDWVDVAPEGFYSDFKMAVGGR